MPTMRPKKMAEMFLMSASTLRNYEAKGIIPPAKRSANGYRVYTNEHAAYLACIQAMSPAFGMETTREVLSFLRENRVTEALWIVKKKDASLYEEKIRLQTLIQDIHLYARSNQAPPTDDWFSIDEVFKKTGAPKSAIRYWEQAGLLTPERDPANDYRRYCSAHVFAIRLLQVLQNCTYSEDTVKLRRSIAETDHMDIQQIRKLAEDTLTYLDKINESQLRGVYYLYKLMRLSKADQLEESKPWEDKLDADF